MCVLAISDVLAQSRAGTVYANCTGETQQDMEQDTAQPSAYPGNKWGVMHQNDAGKRRGIARMAEGGLASLTV